LIPKINNSISPDYSVVVPFYNEAESAGDLLSEIREVMGSLPGAYEAIFVDDGSRDETARLLRGRAAEWPECRVFQFACNQGQAAALYYGIMQAVAPVIVVMDGDGQNDPHDIPALLEALPGFDMVAGIRANRQDSRLRKWMSRTANAVRSRILGDGVTDSGCALKVFRREVRESLLPIRTLYSFIPALAVAAGFRVTEQAVNHRPRLKGTSSYGLGVMLWRPIADMAGIWWFIGRRCETRCALVEGPGNGS
jgi:dolichol-phosphate mannosyltransferase